jgi:hypothetical protein
MTWVAVMALGPMLLGQTVGAPLARHAANPVEISALAGASLSGPTLGAKARFENGLEMGFRHAQLGDAFAQDVGLYYVFMPDEDWMGRPFVGTELFRSNRNDRFGAEDVFAMLLAVGREHRVASRLAISYDVAAGAVLKMNAGDVLPPLTAKARAQLLCRVF